MLAACLLLILAAPAPLRLSDLLREAREKNPDLVAAQERSRSARDAIAPADFSSVPIMFQISQTIPLGGKRRARTDSARASAAMAEADAASQRRDIETQVATAYFD